MSQALEQEIVAHEPMINSVSLVAEQMVNKEHFASTDVQHKLQHLLHELDDLRRPCAHPQTTTGRFTGIPDSALIMLFFDVVELTPQLTV
jgi:hypothetical protein